MATTDSPARPWPVNFHVSACVDAPASGPVLGAFGRTLSNFAPFHKAGWKFERRTLPPPRLYDAERRSMQEPLFVRMDGTFTRCSDDRVEDQDQDDIDVFESLLRCTHDAVRSEEFKSTCNKLVLITYSLSASNNKPINPLLSRYILATPSLPIQSPMQALEQVLHNGINFKLRQLDKAHGACGKGASLGCIESWLWQQKVGYSAVNDALDALAEGDKAQEPPANNKELMDNATKALEGLEKSLNTLIVLINDRVGRYPAVKKSKWKVFSHLRALIRGPLRAVAIDDAALEAHKKQALRLLSTLQRQAPALTFHVRLHEPEARAQLRKVYEKASPEAEKREMVWQLTTSPLQLENKRKRAEEMGWRRTAFDNGYNSLVAEVEAVNKLVGAEYCRRGEEVLKIRGLLGRRVKNPARPCKIDGGKSDDSSEWSLDWDEKGKCQSQFAGTGSLSVCSL